MSIAKLKALLVAVSLLIPFWANAQDTPPPSGTIEIVSKSVAVGVGVNWGDGTLSLNGSTYHFSISGLSVADLGISKITAHGEVFNLKSPADLTGNYAAAAAGIALASGPDSIVLKNDKGVVLRLHGIEQGVRLQLGADGVSIKLK